MLLLKNADLYAPEHIGRSDVLLGGGKILTVSKGLDFRVEGLEIYDLEGKILAPGLIDQHVHITGGGDKGIQEALEAGVVAGYPVQDIKVTLYDGSYHEVDSSEMAFKIAGSMAIKKAMRAANPILLEPIFKVEVTTPEEYMGDVIGDLN